MKRHEKRLLGVLLAVALGGQLYAQPAAPEAPAPAPKQQVAPVVRLSSAQMKTESQRLRDRVRRDIQRAIHLQEVARDSKDIIKLTCVNDRFMKLKAQANLFDTAHRELLIVLDSDARFDVYDRLAVAAAQVQQEREESDACIGEPELAGQSANEYSGPDIIDDPTLGLPFDIEVEPPAYASPYI
jgi:hypothetical protein